MKRFKQYLKEVAWTESLSVMIFDLPRAGLKDLKIPLSPAIFKRIWPESVRSKCFHVTGFDGVRALKKMQGKKKSISAFYNMDDYIISDGIKSEGGYVAELKADILLASQDDVASQPDKTGRRWVTVSTLMNKPTDADPGLGGGAKLKGMEKDISGMLVDIVTKHSDITPLPNINKAWGYLGKSTGGKEKSIIIKDYIDGMEKIMKKHSKSLRSVLTDYTKKRTLEPDPDSGDVAMWDELVVNNFTIQKIHVGPEFSPDFAELVKGEGGGRMYTFANKDDDIEGFPFELYYETGDMVDYINRTLR